MKLSNSQISLPLPSLKAGVVKLVAPLTFGYSAARVGGSSPSTRTNTQSAGHSIGCFFNFKK